MPSRMPLSTEQKCNLLLEIIQGDRRTLDLDEVLNNLLDTLQTVMEYDAAGIFVLNRDIVHPRHTQPTDVIAGIVRRGFADAPGNPDPMLRSGAGVIGYVIRSGKCAVIPDVRQDAHYVEGRKTTLSEIAVPILQDRRPIGALNLESDRLAAYDEEDVEILRFFADAAAITIERAMLHRQLLDKRRVEAQLQVAHDIQQRLLPSQPPVISGYQIAGLCLPNHEVGGDYYDFIPLSNSRLGMVVADVSGDGIPGALVMTAFRALLRTHAATRLPPAGIAHEINQSLPEIAGRSNFVTAVYGVFRPEDGRFRYANCGHNPPLLLRASGETLKLTRTGPLLGMLGESDYEDQDIFLGAGDMLVLYTDGIVEAMTASEDFFGEQRLVQAVRAAAHQPVEGIIAAIVSAVQDFTGLSSFEDDITLVIVRREEPV